MTINYFEAGHLMNEVLEQTGIDFSETKEGRDKFRSMTKDEARQLRKIMKTRPHILKDYVYKNIINKSNPF